MSGYVTDIVKTVMVHCAVASIRKRKTDVKLLFTQKVPKKGWKTVFLVPLEINFQLLTKLLNL
jgi:hypothetical protein